MGINKRIYGMGGRGGRGGGLDILGIRHETFFDRLNVINALDTKYIKVMARLGGYTRKTMQNSMKRPKASAKELKGKKFIDRQGRVLTVASRGQVVDESGTPVSKKFAAYIRKSLGIGLAKGRPSEPGKPPNVHKGTLRALIEFGYEKEDKALVVGPHKIGSPTLPLGGKSVPQLLNEGGQARFRNSGVVATYPARPFVQPAMAKGIKKFRELIATVPFVARERNSEGR